MQTTNIIPIISPFLCEFMRFHTKSCTKILYLIPYSSEFLFFEKEIKYCSFAFMNKLT